jgi:hypothetical protein
MITMTKGALAAFFTTTALSLAAPYAALAAPLTFACDILHSSHPAFELVDEIVIDLEKQSIDFRQADTMETSYARNWIFTNRLEDRLVAMEDIDGIVAFGVAGGRPLGVRLGTDRVLTFAWIAGSEVWSYRWQCRP